MKLTIALAFALLARNVYTCGANGNVIVGNGNHVVGNENTIRGHENCLRGDRDRISGDLNLVRGSDIDVRDSRRCVWREPSISTALAWEKSKLEDKLDWELPSRRRRCYRPTTWDLVDRC